MNAVNFVLQVDTAGRVLRVGDLMSSQPLKLILASQSPRRRRLLSESGYQFDVIVPSEAAETGAEDLPAPELVRRFAYRKAAEVAPQVEQGIVLGCDTVAECGGQILGKPRNSADARAMLGLLRGRSQHVYSGLCLWRRPDDEVLTKVAVTKLHMEEISRTELERYLNSGDWEGKAGGFGYQDRLGWLRILHGSESNVVGLPLELFEEMLSDLTDS